MAKLPRAQDELVERIYAAIRKERHREGVQLTRLGASSIGVECSRRLFMAWRAFDTASHDGRVHRLFDTGHREEERIIADLRRAGLGVWDKTEEGKQFEYTDETGHFVVKLDGVVKGVPGAEQTAHVLEIKTHNTNSFKDLIKNGLALSKPGHYQQIQAGMMYSGVNRGLYVAVCKDNEDYYIERVHPDQQTQTLIEERIRDMREARIVPAGISDDAGAWGCKYCDLKEVCVKEKPPVRTCRSCEHSYADEDGNWVCELLRTTLTYSDQLKACDEYSSLLKD